MGQKRDFEEALQHKQVFFPEHFNATFKQHILTKVVASKLHVGDVAAWALYTPEILPRSGMLSTEDLIETIANGSSICLTRLSPSVKEGIPRYCDNVELSPVTY